MRRPAEASECPAIDVAVAASARAPSLGADATVHTDGAGLGPFVGQGRFEGVSAGLRVETTGDGNERHAEYTGRRVVVAPARRRSRRRSVVESETDRHGAGTAIETSPVASAWGCGESVRT